MAPRACLIVEPLMIDLTSRSSDPESKQANDDLHDEDGCRDRSN